jgi:hypothetical protein
LRSLSERASALTQLINYFFAARPRRLAFFAADFRLSTEADFFFEEALMGSETALAADCFSRGLALSSFGGGGSRRGSERRPCNRFRGIGCFAHNASSCHIALLSPFHLHRGERMQCRSVSSLVRKKPKKGREPDSSPPS